MKERPILFSGAMVRAILEGRKTQTRRTVKAPLGNAFTIPGENFSTAEALKQCPYGRPGDRLWVRETWQMIPDDGGTIVYRATDPDWEATEAWTWRPSIFMRRDYSRITLEITSVRVEQLQAIGKDGRKGHDVFAEGITAAAVEQWRQWLHPDDAPAHTYGVLWESINGKGSWARNPWVWVIEFKVLPPEAVAADQNSVFSVPSC